MASFGELPVQLVARYRAVDRELVGSGLVDTPAHLHELQADITVSGIRVPLTLCFNEEFAVIDGNHRLAVAFRLGLPTVPVAVAHVDTARRPAHARTMLYADYRVLRYVLATGPEIPFNQELPPGLDRGARWRYAAPGQFSLIRPRDDTAPHP